MSNMIMFLICFSILAYLNYRHFGLIGLGTFAATVSLLSILKGL